MTGRGRHPNSRAALKRINAKPTAKARPHLATYHSPEHLEKMRARKRTRKTVLPEPAPVVEQPEAPMSEIPEVRHESPPPPATPRPERLEDYTITPRVPPRTVGLFSSWWSRDGRVVSVRTTTHSALRARLGDKDVWFVPATGDLVEEHQLDPLPLPPPPVSEKKTWGDHMADLAQRDRALVLSGRTLSEGSTFQTGAGRPPRLGRIDWAGLGKL
jgi:hypothetical protein